MEAWIAWAALVLSLGEAVVIVLVLREIAILRVSGAGRRSGLKVDQMVPAITAPTVTGTLRDLGALRRALLVFVSADCEMCRDLVESLRSASSAGGLPPLVLAVTNYGRVDVGSPFVRSLDFVSGEDVILDPGRQIYVQLDVPVTPWAYAVNAQGRVRGSGMTRTAEELAEMAKAVR